MPRRAIRTTELTERQAEILLEVYAPIADRPVFHQECPNDKAFWVSLDRQRLLDPNGRIIARLFNLGLLAVRTGRACTLSWRGVDLAERICRQRRSGLNKVA